MTSHTPGPYEAETGGRRGAWIRGSNGNWIALSCGETDAEAEANTAMIVHRCNAHEKLVTAAKAALALGNKVYHNANAHEAPRNWAETRKLLAEALGQA